MSPSDYLVKATRAMTSAKLLLDAGDRDGACNRAYYAMFDAAQASLLWVTAPVNPVEIKTHRGLIAAFGKHLVKPGLLAADLGKAFNQVERIRLLADYTGEEVDSEKARWAVEQAGVFVATLQQMLTARKPTPRNDSDPYP